MRMIRTRRILLGCALASGVVLGACTTIADMPPGTPLAELQAQYGAPNFRCVTAQGQQRVIWTTQPYGQYAWGSDIDAAGNAVRVEALLTSTHFRRLADGIWDKERVRCEFGPPAEIGPVGLPPARQEVWSYRFKENQTWNSLMYVYFDPHSGRVTRHHPGPDPMYEPNDLWLD